MSRVTDILVAAVAIVVVFATMVIALNEAGAFDEHEEHVEDPGYFLFDAGNGDTKWGDANGGSYVSIITDVAADAGYSVTYDGALSVDGKESAKIGGVESEWRFYVWNGDAWSDRTGTSLDQKYTGGDFAVGFYPEGVFPAETPEYKSSWTMVCGDALNSGHQDAQRSGNAGSYAWTKAYSGSYVDTTVLVKEGRVYVDGSGAFGGSEPPAVYCYDFDGNEIWRYAYDKGAGWECNTGAIFGDSYYLPASNGNVYKIPLAGPGADGKDVKILKVGNTAHDKVVGHKNNTGPSSLVYDSGVIYFGTSNGYVYCVDSDLNVIWNTAITGSVYYTSPTVCDGKVYMGAGDGALHVLDQATGELVEKYTFGQKTEEGTVTYGYMGAPVISGDVMYVAANDMTNKMIVACDMTDSGLKERFTAKGVEYLCAYILPVDSQGKKGVYVFQDKVMTFVSEDGTVKELATLKHTIKAPMTLVNGTEIYANSYSSGGNLYCLSLDGETLGAQAQPDNLKQYSMSNIVVIDDMIFNGNDKGVLAYQGAFPEA